MLEALSSPLDFNSDDALGPSPLPSPRVSPPAIMPIALLPNVMPCIVQPPAATIELQEMEAITDRVNHMHIQTAPECTSAPSKNRAASVPSRRSARQAAASSTVLMSQRAALRLVKELGELRPKDKMTPKAATRLIKHFNEPLTDADIQTIARLTNLDINALKIAVGALGLDGAAKAAE
ncbi:hypothetical protein VPH35_110782 [Triticum aestivum]